MSSDRLLEIPELVSLIGQHLDQHDFTVCIRVCRAWFDVFTPLLYHTIAVYEFDLYSHKFEGATSRSRRSFKNASLASSDEDPGCGGSMVYKYGHLIHSITSSNIHALTYLGEQAVNLTHVAIRRSSIDDVLYRPLYADDTEKLNWSQYWAEIQDRELIISTWVALIDRNPGLKSVRVDLSHCCSGTERIIHALAKCEHLEDVYLSSMVEPNTLEMMLDHCPQILSLSTTCGTQTTTKVPGFRHQTFRAESKGNVGASTKIRHFDIRTHEPWIPYVLRRCPDLLSLILPSVGMDIFIVLAQEVITLSLSKFFRLRSLELTLQASSIQTHKILLATLFNSCSASLTAMTITDTFGHDFGKVVIPHIDPLVWSRLEEFHYTGRDFDKHKTPSYHLCRVLALCPNLRVFEISMTMITASEFLTTPFVCSQTLASLKLTVCNTNGDHGTVRAPNYPATAATSLARTPLYATTTTTQPDPVLLSG
ncbi:hypothetical protein BGZ96_009745 [Linnemannia gamsii]|uniref:F-box domain-containing protein n=1 Tax=Linnemannia gamsii TaxID=64522 RepID=A0ABQ7JVZ3_9FUNG|nr:hypothetical protein BGZ96_009745 [Linnemannia gamsii]